MSSGFRSCHRGTNAVGHAEPAGCATKQRQCLLKCTSNNRCLLRDMTCLVKCTLRFLQRAEEGCAGTCGPSRHFSMTPGRKFSTNTSERFARLRSTSRPSSLCRSMVMHRLLRPYRTHCFCTQYFLTGPITQHRLIREQRILRHARTYVRHHKDVPVESVIRRERSASPLPGGST